MPTYDENFYNGGGDIGGYDEYSETTYFNENFQQLADKFVQKTASAGLNISGKKILVVGCAYGYLVKWLVSLGVDAYGMDISSYAISQAPQEIAGRLMVGDMSVESSFISAKQMAGLTKPNDKFDLIIDEDAIACLTNAEAISFRTAALKHTNLLFHLFEQNDGLSQWYNYKTIAQWKALLGTSPKEKWFARFSWNEN
jgi:2-polyprenyl-3-methyl-5-hydroxy-6-metoxy-1,4-benzoquinol methylase